MLKRGTLGLLLAAIALTGGVLLFENRTGSNSSQTSETGADSEATDKLFPIEEEDIMQFSVVRQQTETTEASSPETLSFEKNEDGTWQMLEPENAIAESGAIAFLLNQITSPTARPVTLDNPNADLEEFGLATPDYTVDLTANDQDYSLKVGGLDFVGDSRYVQAITETSSTADSETDPSETDLEDATSAESLEGIYVVPGGILNAVQRPTTEWLIADDTNVENSDKTEANAEEDSAEENAAEENTSEENSTETLETPTTP